MKKKSKTPQTYNLQKQVEQQILMYERLEPTDIYYDS